MNSVLFPTQPNQHIRHHTTSWWWWRRITTGKEASEVLPLSENGILDGVNILCWNPVHPVPWCLCRTKLDSLGRNQEQWTTQNWTSVTCVKQTQVQVCTFIASVQANSCIFFLIIIILTTSKDSSVSIATGHVRSGQLRRQSLSPSEEKIFLLSTLYGPVMGPTQHPMQWELRALSPGVKWPWSEANHNLQLMSRSRRDDPHSHPHTPSWWNA